MKRREFGKQLVGSAIGAGILGSTADQDASAQPVRAPTHLPPLPDSKFPAHCPA